MKIKENNQYTLEETKMVKRVATVLIKIMEDLGAAEPRYKMAVYPDVNVIDYRVETNFGENHQIIRDVYYQITDWMKNNFPKNLGPCSHGVTARDFTFTFSRQLLLNDGFKTMVNNVIFQIQ